MKFLCPQCSAKYKIGDEKLAGRKLVRMKCRKCDSTVEIRPHASGVPGRFDVAVMGNAAPKIASPVIQSMPAATAANGMAGRTSQRPTAPAPAGVPSSAVPSTISRNSGLSEQTLGLLTDDLGLRDLGRRTESLDSKGKDTAGAPRAGGTPLAVPRPGPARSAALRGLRIGRPPQRAARPAHLNQTLVGVAPAANPVASAEGASSRAASPGSAPLMLDAELGVQQTPAERPARGMAAAALAQRETESEEEADSTEILNEEFSGVVTSGEPANDPESHASGSEAAPPEPAQASGDSNAESDSVDSEELPTNPPPAPAAWFVGVGDEPKGPLDEAQVKALIEAGELTPESLAWKDGMGDWQPVSELEPLAALFHAPENAVAEAASGEPPEAEERKAPVTGSRSAPAKRGVMPPLAWLAMLVAVAFGATATYVLLPKGQTIVREVPAPTTQEPTEPAAPAQEASATAESVAAEETPPADEETKPEETKPEPAAPTAGESATNRVTSNKANADSTKPKSKPAEATADKQKRDTDSSKGGLLGNLSAPPQPSGPASGKDDAAAPKKQLDGMSISKVVRRQTPSVKRACWNQALMTATSDAPSSARVMVSATIAASGSVKSVSTSGDPRGYRGLARCIEGKVRAWRFPAAEGTTTANIPFVFAAQ